MVSALICGRNPKEISAELGHTTPRMVLSVYDAFLGAASWPGDEERRRLARGDRKNKRGLIVRERALWLLRVVSAPPEAARAEGRAKWANGNDH